MSLILHAFGEKLRVISGEPNGGEFNLFFFSGQRMNIFRHAKSETFFGVTRKKPSNFILLILFIVLFHYKSSQGIKLTIVLSL